MTPSLYRAFWGGKAHAALLTEEQYLPASWTGPGLTQIFNSKELVEGDVVSIAPSGQLVRQYRANSSQNFLLATERCNSNCLMCSQPPRDRDDTRYLLDIYR
ncbi:MAG: hypothetical protein ACRYFX_29390 [Janthinobacterium lividum]